MNPRHLIPGILSAGLLILSSAASADPAKADEMIKSMREAAETLDDFTCVVKIENITEKETAVQLGKLNWLAPAYVKSTNSIPGPDGEMKTLLISDGKDVYTETRGPTGDPSIFHYKIKPPANVQGGALARPVAKEAHTPSEMFEQLSPMYDWDVDETTNGGLIQDMAMDVIIGKYRKGAAAEHIKPEFGKEKDRATARRIALRRNLIESMAGSMRVWIGRTDKFIHRIELIPPESTTGAPEGPLASLPKQRMVTTYLDVKFDQSQAPADFVYTVPAGAYVSELPDN